MVMVVVEAVVLAVLYKRTCMIPNAIILEFQTFVYKSISLQAHY